MAVPLEGAPAYLRAEIAYAISHEGALHLDDLMMRRTRMVYEYVDEADAALDEVAAIATESLGWTAEHAATEIRVYRERAAAEAQAATMRDDASAAAVRESAEEIVPLVTGR